MWLEEEDDPPVDDDFEVDLEAVDVVSVALAVVSLVVNALVSDSILAATAPVTRDENFEPLVSFAFLVPKGAYAVSNIDQPVIKITLFIYFVSSSVYEDYAMPFYLLRLIHLFWYTRYCRCRGSCCYMLRVNVYPVHFFIHFFKISHAIFVSLFGSFCPPFACHCIRFVNTITMVVHES